MTDRENVLGLVRRTGYETLPTYFSLVPDTARRFREYCEKTEYTPP